MDVKSLFVSLTELIGPEKVGTVACVRNHASNTIHDFRRTHHVREAEDGVQESSASEMLMALACANGYVETCTDAIYQHVQQRCLSQSFRESDSMPKDHPELRSHGQFTAEYNRPLPLR